MNLVAAYSQLRQQLNKNDHTIDMDEFQQLLRDGKVLDANLTISKMTTHFISSNYDDMLYEDFHEASGCDLEMIFPEFVECLVFCADLKYGERTPNAAWSLTKKFQVFIERDLSPNLTNLALPAFTTGADLGLDF